MFRAKLVAVKTLLAIASTNKCHLVQLDVNNAFLNGDLLEEIYMGLLLGHSNCLLMLPKKVNQFTNSRSPFMALDRLLDNYSQSFLKLSLHTIFNGPS